MAMDRLQGLLQHFSVRARMFHSGPLCGITDFSANGQGQLHLVRRGPVEVVHRGESLTVSEPSLLLYPRPMAHRLITDADTGADMACANLAFGAEVSTFVANDGGGNAISRALPAFTCLPLSDLPGAGPVLELLFDEAFAQRCGRIAVVDRLFDVVLVLLLRRLLDSGHAREGALAGLGHPRLAKALVAIHDRPSEAWTLASLADVAGMSRSRYAEVFLQVVGQTPAAYLASHRITLAQQALLRGEPLERTAQRVGYGSAAALSRAFTAACGQSPRAWRLAALAKAD